MQEHARATSSRNISPQLIKKIQQGYVRVREHWHNKPKINNKTLNRTNWPGTNAGTKQGPTRGLIIRISQTFARHVKAMATRFRFAQTTIVLAWTANGPLRIVRAETTQPAVDWTRWREQHYGSRNFHVSRTSRPARVVASNGSHGFLGPLDEGRCRLARSNGGLGAGNGGNGGNGRR
jgi:hypothetical protein